MEGGSADEIQANGEKDQTMNVPLRSGESLGGRGLMFEKPELSVEEETHGGKTVPRGSLLTSEQLAAMNIGGDLQ